MLEEFRMDKKSVNRPSQTQSRATAIDCKKNSDLTTRPWPRNNKKREGPGGAPNKNDTPRKNVPTQRGRGQFDKRSRPRGSGYLVGGTPNSGLEDYIEPEIGSVFVPGSKKQNFNHLLNFMYPSRGGHERNENRPTPRRYAPSRTSHRHEHDLYLRAYCQFVVREDGDYKANLLDPDMPIKWDEIEEIVIRSTGSSECPICLGTPAAGRVSLCGHVYCWACVLHYAAEHDKKPPPCPVCAAPLHIGEMKPTRMVQWKADGEEVTMNLVRRLRGSTSVEVAPPRGQGSNIEASAILPVEEVNRAPYAKMFSATKKQLLNIVERERDEIQKQIMAEIDTTEIVFLEEALNLLKLKEEKMNMRIEEPILSEEKVEVAPIVYEKNVQEPEHKIDWFDVEEDGATCVETVQEQVEKLDINNSILNPEAPQFELQSNNQVEFDEQVEEFPLIESASDNKSDGSTFTDFDKETQAKYFYFYQAEDGQQVFLNSLNVRILIASWGSLTAAPPVIRGRVLHRETLSLAEQTRKHMPYTAHLPLHCCFDVVELDLQPPYVTSGALNNFTDELDRRARLRARHERDERRRERAYRRKLEGPPRPDLSSAVLFPAGPGPSPPLYPAGPGPSPPLYPTGPGPSPPQEVCVSPGASPSAANVATSPSGLSFAKMASTSGTWRVRPATRAASPPPPADTPAPLALNLSEAIEAAIQARPTKKDKKSKKLLFATASFNYN